MARMVKRSWWETDDTTEEGDCVMGGSMVVANDGKGLVDPSRCNRRGGVKFGKNGNEQVVETANYKTGRGGDGAWMNFRGPAVPPIRFCHILPDF